MIWIAITAVGFALFGVGTGFILSTAVLVGVAAPFRSPWQNLETAVGVAWLLGIAGSSSEVADDELGVACVYLPCGLLLGCSWLLRECRQFDDPAWKISQARPTSLILPGLLLLGGLLLDSDLDFRVRLALSESSLRAESLRVAPGVTRRFRPRRRVGLFTVTQVESWNGCVLWYTEAVSFWEERGLVYVLGPQAPSRPMYGFQHVRGPWWRFRVVWD